MTFEGSYEEGLLRLEELTNQLRRDDLSLTDSTRLYQEAQEIGKVLHEKLDQAELVIRDLEGQAIPVVLESQENGRE